MRKKYLKFLVVLIPFLVMFPLIFTNKEIIKENEVAIKETTLPNGIVAYTLNGEKTNITFNELINGYTINKITCKNGSSATYNKEDNSISLSNIHMPDYCTMDFKHSIYSKLLADNRTIKTRTSFNTTFTETNTGTLFQTTESIAGAAAKTVYYFAGAPKDNWVKFAGFYWRIIRTNHDGSIKLLYAGTSPDTTSGYIGESAFNSSYNSPKYAGYMYGTDGSLSESRTNTNNSTIKTYIDNWYSTNLSSYSKYISTEAVYCNDRQLDSGQTWSTSSSSSFNYITYTRLDWNGSGANANPTYDCADSHDAFSASNTDAKLTYPISLMTADEINIAGGLAYNNAPAYYYLNSAGGSITGGLTWWSLSPLGWRGGYSRVWSVGGSREPGALSSYDVNSSGSVRPAISIKSDAIWSSGDGSPENPYEIVYN